MKPSVKHLGTMPYPESYEKMLNHIEQQNQSEIWILEHPPVFTKGRRSLPEHFLKATDIPTFATDRGGQVTYHGPGQMIIYPLLHLASWQLSPQGLVTLLEDTTIQTLNTFGVISNSNKEARGVYIQGRKVGSIGLKIKQGYSYHGMAINLNMDLSPFEAIVACGDEDMLMTNVINHVTDIDAFQQSWCDNLVAKLSATRYNSTMEEA